MEREEKLFAGNSNWFFGIWVCGSTPFNGKNIEAIVNPSNFDKYKNKYDENQLKNMSESEAAQKKGQNEEQPFYLPIHNIENSNSDIYPVQKEYASEKESLENTLVGQISMTCRRIELADGSHAMATEYYFPFIQSDYIHSGRIGGSAFYEIDGINASNGILSDFIFPNVRMSRNEGTDRTYGHNFDFSYATPELLQDAKELGNSLKVNASTSVGGNNGTNVNDGRLTQTIMDVNGDSIPDIIQETPTGVYITPSKKSPEGKIVYCEKYEIDGVNINSIHSEIDVNGASFSPSGSISMEFNKGKPNHVKASGSSNGGAGVTKTFGKSSVKTGLIDINGDGLPDFYDGVTAKLNLGETFESTQLISVPAGDMNASSINSVSANLNIGKASGFGESLSCGINCGGGLSYTSSSNATNSMFIDINGDGLADRLTQKAGALSVLYNTGNSFVESLDILLPSWKLSEAERQKIGKGKDTNFEAAIFSDVPLIGPMTKGIANAVPAYDPFAEKSIDGMESSTTISLSINGSLGLSFTFCIPVPIPFAPFSINPTFSGGNGLTGSTSINMVNVSMTDLDGDGLADHALRIPGVATYWKRNISGRYGLLAKINLPQGGNIEIDYSEKYGTTDNPNFKYVLSKVTMNDGCDEVLPKTSHGEHSVTTVYEYEDGYYDRARKDFYGFQTVKTINSDGTYKIDEYYNREYYAKGSLKESKCYSSDNILLSRSTTELLDSPCPLPIKEESWTYEKSSGTNNYIHLVTEYEYDTYGNCTKITQDFGDGEKLVGVIQYDNSNTGSYIIGLPTDISVYNASGNLLRHRAGVYNGYGELTELHQYYDSNSYSINKLSYTKHGNIESVADSRGATLSYKYDGDEYMFVNEISQSGAGTDTYTSYMTYDPITQTKTKETDCNGNTLRYEYDDWQRIVSIWTSYDTGSTPAVSYEYHTPNNDSFGHHELWYAVTNNKVTFDADDENIIQTVIQIDGLGRAVRTAKTGFVNGVAGWNASGAVEYDEKGRTVKEGMTEFIQGDIQTLLESVPKMTALYTAYEYDEKDRHVKTILPDGSSQTNAFYIEENKLISETTDPLGNISVQETDSRGNIGRVAKNDKDGKRLTEVTYRYNAMGEMLKAFDAKGHPITAEYDLLGRRTALESLDSGRQEFFYDECSNVVRENNSVLRESNKQILYEYDGLNRLIRIDYPDTEDTIYTYGNASDKSVGAAGKILSVTDASGTLEYEYGRLGEVTKETRTINTHLNGNNPSETAVMEYCSDYLGRMQWITYPDGEQIVYGYDRGGQVVSVKGEHWGHDFDYVTNILYDEYGQRTRIDYGNGTFTEYNYDPARRWLDSIKTENKWGQTYQNIVYSFDAVGNVLGYENDCLDSVTGNYKTKQTYSYDNLYQLVKVDGETTYNPYHSSVPEFYSNYSQTFTFDDMGLGNMTSKVSKETVSPHKSIGDNLNYSFNYAYDENFAHRLINAGDRYYKYDSNGNIICEQDGSFESNGDDTVYHKINRESEDVYSTDYGWGLFKEDDSNGGIKGTRYCRTYAWNEKNQLISSVDSNYNTAYVYGQDGQRSNKYTQNSETLYFNKMWTLHTDSGNSVYGGQSAKNIYLGETRIVTKLNSGTNPTYQEEYYKQYYYHSDHLGSASLISDYKGDEYQRIEYTPYGETWVEKTDPKANLNFLPYKFTGKELDEETGLYYYGARYLDPRYSMWISTDPALGEYIPKAPVNEEAKRYNQNLPGMGGVFNHINSNLYHYAGNNPVCYTDPNGKFFNVIAAVAGGVIGAGVGAISAAIAGGSTKDVIAAAVGGAAGGALAGFTCGASLIAGAAVGAVVAAGTDIAINAVQGNDLLDGVDKAAFGGGVGGAVGIVAGPAVANTMAVAISGGSAAGKIAIDFANQQKYMGHIFSKEHLKNGIMNLGINMQDIFDKVVNCIQSIDPSRITEKSNEFRTTIDGIETTVRFYVQNGQVINIDAFVGYSERAIGNLIQ